MAIASPTRPAKPSSGARARQDNNSWFPLKVLNAGDQRRAAHRDAVLDTTLYIYNTAFGFNVGDQLRRGDERHRRRLQGDRSRPPYASARHAERARGQLRGVRLACLLQAGGPRSRATRAPSGSASIELQLDGAANRHGGVLRSNMKYVGPLLPDGTTNPKKPNSGSTASLINNPDGASGLNSGVINYINKFSDAALQEPRTRSASCSTSRFATSSISAPRPSTPPA